MKVKKLSEWMTIATNLAVVAGIIGLVIEINQNTSQLRAQASYNLLQNRVTGSHQAINNPEVAEFWLRMRDGDSHSRIDYERLGWSAGKAILNWQWERGQFLDGNLSKEELPVQGYRRRYRDGYWNTNPFPEIWLETKPTLRPDFVAWMEATVIE